VNPLTSFSQKIDFDLFYCHENIIINSIWPLGNNGFVANVKVKNDQEMRNNMFLLYNKTHLIKDTLYINGGIFNYLNTLDEDKFVIHSTLYSETIKIRNEQFEVIKKEKNFGALKNLLSNNFNEYMLGTFKGLQIGYTTKAKNRTLKRSKKNIPKYFYLNEKNEKVWINSGKEPVVGDQWESFTNKQLFDLGEVSRHLDNVYFNIPMVGTCYILNIKTKKIQTVLYPTEGAKSWFLTVDKKTGIHYLAGHLQDNSYDIYHIDLKKNKKTFLNNFKGFRDLIFNDKILYTKEIDEGSKSFDCYYLTNVYTKKP